jgi:hypothetical protein
MSYDTLTPEERAEVDREIACDKQITEEAFKLVEEYFDDDQANEWCAELLHGLDDTCKVVDGRVVARRQGDSKKYLKPMSKAQYDRVFDNFRRAMKGAVEIAFCNMLHSQKEGR